MMTISSKAQHSFAPSLHFISQRGVKHDGAQPDHEERRVRGDEPLLEPLFRKSEFSLIQRFVIRNFFGFVILTNVDTFDADRPL